MNTGVPWPADVKGAWHRVLVMQTKLHRWAAAEPGRRFDDLFNLVYDPAFLVVAWDRVRSNRGGRTAGVDGVVPRDVPAPRTLSVLSDLRRRVRSGRFTPERVRRRRIPKAGGKVRSLGIPTMADRIVQASLKLVLEPIFEADFHPSSYGFRPRRRAQDAIAEIHKFTSRPADYEWVFEADIEACFDEIDHTALMGRVRERVGDKRILALIRGFLKAGVLSEDGVSRRTLTGTPQGGILSPLLANIALSVLDWHLQRKWDTLGPGRGAREAPAPRGRGDEDDPLRGRLRHPRPRDARRCPGAAGGGRPGPGPDGTETVGGQDETDPHRGGVRYSSGGASSAARRREPAGRPGSTPTRRRSHWLRSSTGSGS